MPRTIDIKAFIDERPVAAGHWLLVTICFLVMVADGIGVTSVGRETSRILQDWAISRPAFGIVITAASFGLVVVALLASPLSDRFGRKRVLVSSVLVFGLLTGAAAEVSTSVGMAALCFLAGAGMGAALRNASTLLVEYAPQRRRCLMITMMYTAFTLGSALIGFVAGSLVPLHGGRSVLLVDGIVLLALVPIIAACLPESVRWLALRGATARRIAAILARVIQHLFSDDEALVSNEPPLATCKPIGVLFAPSYAVTIVSLGITNSMVLLVSYFFTCWFPTLVKHAELPISTAANVTAMFQIGGTIGATLTGYAMDKASMVPIIDLTHLRGGLCILGVPTVGIASAALTALVFVAGFRFSGAQTGLNAYVPGCYPTAVRATGVSWIFGIDCFGSIVGSSIGGTLLRLDWNLGPIMGTLAVSAFCATVAIVTTRLERADPVAMPARFH